jgi:flagellar biogenesis protein FliO
MLPELARGIKQATGARMTTDKSIFLAFFFFLVWFVLSFAESRFVSNEALKLVQQNDVVGSIANQ